MGTRRSIPLLVGAAPSCCAASSGGPWTAHYIAMRVVGHSDAWPAGDLGLRKALARNGSLPSAADVARAADARRPFRAYAAMYLRRSLG